MLYTYFMPISPNEQELVEQALRRFAEAMVKFNENPRTIALRVLAKYSHLEQSEVLANPKRALRLARANTHPDRVGNRREWDGFDFR